MAFSQLPSPKKSSSHSSSKLKQKRVVEFKKKKKKPTRPLCKDKEVNALNPKEDEETTMKLVKCVSNEHKVDSTNHPRGLVAENFLALTRAQNVQENLETNFPSFVKYMLRSHVTKGFWLGLPRSFCLENLPKHDKTVVLVGENDKEYETKYLANKSGLSGGWKGFSIAHNLMEGDVLVFQLMEEWKFKVFIVRASGLTELDGAMSLLDIHLEAKPIGFLAKTSPVVEGEAICEALNQEYAESPGSPGSCSDQAYSKRNDPMMLVDISKLPSDQFVNEGHEDLGPVMLDEIKFLEAVDFKDVKSFEEFNILVDGVTVDSEVREHIRKKYYELCCSQKCYLHEQLLAGLNFQLVAGMISETVNIADAIRAADFITPYESLETWDKTLKPLEDLGMEVGFLRERLKMLVSISEEQKKKLETKTLERTALEEEMRTIELKILDAKREMRSLDDEMEALTVEGNKSEVTFQETAFAPW